MRFLARLLLNGLAIVLATYIVPGLRVDAPATAIVAGVILGLVNMLIRPVLLIVTFPLTLITLGLFIFVVNALCLAVTAALVPGFAVDGVVPAFFGALVITIVSWILNGVLVGKKD